MPACPDADQLESLLAGTLTGSAADTLTSHVEHCPACQTALDALTAPPISWGAGAADTRPTPRFLDRIAADRPALGSVAPPTIPGFDLLEELGRGGVGTVYKARQLEPDRVVALKILLGGERATADELARFRAEAEAAGRLGHPNIVRVYQVGAWQARPDAPPLPYVCLEYVGGGTLDRAIGKVPQPPRRAAEVLAKLADAVQAAHDQGIVHRDLKPANVLLDTAGEPKVADFGIAKRLDPGSGNTQTGTILGTPSYMAPEQARGDVRAVGTRTDVYGLGAVLYEMLTGRPPFQAPTALETVVQVSNADPIPPRQLQPSVPRDLDTICLKCLEKAPDRRYASAQALADDLGRYLAGRPIAARPIGPAGRLAKWGRRNPAATVLSTLLLCLVVGSVAALSHLYLDAEGQRKEAVKERLAAVAAREESDADRKVAVAAGEEAEVQREVAVEERKKSDADRKVAVAAREEAEESLALAKKASKGLAVVSMFFQKRVLAAPRPGGRGAGERVTLLQALDAAEPDIAAEFAGQPEVEAAIRDTLTNTYYSLGQFEKARVQAERVLAVRASYQAADEPERLAAQNNLALAYLRLGRLEEAGDLLRATYDARAKRLGPTDPATVGSMNSLSGYLIFTGRLREAAKLLEEAIGILERTGPADDSHLPALKVNLANVLLDLNRAADAEPHLRDALRWREQALPADHADRIAVYTSLAACFQLQRKYDEAGRWAAKALASAERSYGAGTPEAIEAAGRQLAILAMSGKTGEAFAGFRKLFDGPVSRLPPTHSARTNFVAEYITRLLAAKRPADAAALADESLAAHRKALPADSPVLATWLMLAGESALAAGRPADAEAMAAEAVAIREKKLPAGSWRLDSARSLLAGCLAARGEHAKAEPTMLECHRRMDQAEGVPPWVLRSSRERLAALYEATGQPTKAAEWREAK